MLTYDHHLSLTEGEPPMPCPICTGDSDAPPCGEECADLMARVTRARRIRGLYEASRRALTLAKSYAFSSPAGIYDTRVTSCLKQVWFYRADIADLRRSA